MAIFDVLQKTMCRHRLDAEIVQRPFILPIFFAHFFALDLSLRCPFPIGRRTSLRPFTWLTCGSTHSDPGSRFGRHLDRVCSAISEASRG